MPATKSAFSSLPARLATPDFVVGHEADELEQAVAGTIRERARLLFEQSGGQPGQDQANWLRAEAEILRGNMNVQESGTWISVSAPIPDASGQGIAIVVRARRVVVRAMQDREEQSADNNQAEIFLAANLPVDVDPLSAVASFRNHDLHIMVKKLRPAKVLGSSLSNET
jgi:HSP20 family molecular chaperone IbpA